MTRYGLIGEKLGHSFSKLIHEQLADYTYDLIPLDKDAFHDFMKKKEELCSFPQQENSAIAETDIRMVPISELQDFEGHPFKVENDMALFELMQSIEKEGVIVAHSEAELDALLAERDSDNVMIIGGGKVYRDFLKKCDTCYITKIYKAFEGADTHFVNLDAMPEFKVVWESEIQEENGIRYQFFEYRRVNHGEE